MHDYEEFKELIPLQEKQCEILKYIDEFCTENDIEYCLAYGSALGAARHKGPIPWDDDSDVLMTAKGFEKFREIFNEKGDKERFYLQQFRNVDGRLNMYKLRMNGTTFIEDSLKDLDMHHGIYVDIFLLHECPPTKLAKAKGVIATCYRIMKEMSAFDYSKRKAVRPIIKFLRLFPADFGLRSAYNTLYKWDNTNQDKFADWDMYTGNPRWFIAKDTIFPAVRADYMDCSFCVPRKLDEYLSICYGNWRKIPEIDKIQWAQHATEWSVSRDFRESLPQIKDFSDERI